MTRITISLKDQEKSALRILAEKEFREPRAQAALIIRRELERRGLLKADSGILAIEQAKNIKKQQGEKNVRLESC